MSKSPCVLFVTYGGGHVSMVLPVIQALESVYPDWNFQLMALTTGHQRAKSVRPTLGYRDFLHLVDKDLALSWGQRLSEGNTSPDVPADETIAYMGVNYLDLIAQHGHDGAAEYFRQHGRYGFMPMNFMRRLLASLGPDVVVATNSPRSEQAALEVATEMRIPNVGMVDLFGLDSDPYVLRSVKPQCTCVISPQVRQRLLSRGFPASGVVVTGNPAFDGLFSESSQVAAREFLAARGWTGLKTILYAGHVEPYSHPATTAPAGQALPLQIESELRAFVRAHEDVALIVRYHPSDWHSYPQQASQPRVHVSEPPREPIHPLILAADAVVVQTSTVGLESAVAGKPVVSVENSPAAHIWFSLAQLGVSTPCPNPQTLPAVLSQVLAQENAGQTNYHSDGQAAQRIARVIASAMSTSSNNTT